MKRVIISVLVLVFCSALCSLVTYHFGYATGFARAKELQKGTFVVSLDALQKLRSGDLEQATRKMEALCFSSADMLYGDPAYRDQFVTTTFAPELIQYRATYRSNSIDWSPAEQKLEQDLATWKR